MQSAPPFMLLAAPITEPTLCKRHAKSCRRCHTTRCFTALASRAIRLLVATVRRRETREVGQAERNRDAETDEHKKDKHQCTTTEGRGRV